MKLKKQYWAVGLNFDYDIVNCESDTQAWGSMEGPFDSLSKAKKHIRYWIKSDRIHLSNKLAMINELKESR